MKHRLIKLTVLVITFFWQAVCLAGDGQLRPLAIDEKNNGVLQKASLLDYGLAWMKHPGKTDKYIMLPVAGRERKPLPGFQVEVETAHVVAETHVYRKLQELVLEILTAETAIRKLTDTEIDASFSGMQAFFKSHGLVMTVEGQVIKFEDVLYLKDSPEKFRPHLVRVNGFELAVFQSRTVRGGLPSNRYYFTLAKDNKVICEGTFHVKMADKKITEITGETINEFMFYLDPASDVKGHKALAAILAAIYNFRGRNVSKITTIPGETYEKADMAYYENMIRRHVWSFFVRQGFMPQRDLTMEKDDMTTREAVMVARTQPLTYTLSREDASRLLSRGLLTLHLPLTRHLAETKPRSVPMRDVREMVQGGLTYEEAAEWRKLLSGQKSKVPYGFWTNHVTARNMILATLDTIDDDELGSFKKAREDGDVRVMAGLYRKHVIKHEGGQLAFFRQRGALGRMLSTPRDYLAEKAGPGALLRFALPELLDITNPDALDPLEVERYYWTAPDNAAYHVTQLLNTIPGFREARKTGNIGAMADLYRANVLDRPGRQVRFFCERGKLSSLVTNPIAYVPEKGRIAALLNLAVNGLVDGKNPHALKFREVTARFTGELAQMKRQKAKSDLMELLLKPLDYDWQKNKEALPHLKGADIGLTNNGSIILHMKSIAVPISILGTTESGWRVRIADFRVISSGLCEIEFLCTKRGQPAIKRTLQMGGVLRRLMVFNKEITLLMLSQRLGLIPIVGLMCKPYNHKWEVNEEDIPHLEGYSIGATNSHGELHFSLAPYLPSYDFRWQIFNSKEKMDRQGWHGTIVDTGLRGGFPRLLVRWTKENEEPRYRIYQIGPYVKEANGINKNKGRSRAVFGIFDVTRLARTAGKEEMQKEKKLFNSESNDKIDKVDTALTPDNQASFNEMMDALNAVISQMPPYQQSIAHAIISEQMVDDLVVPNASTQEIAAIKRRLQGALRDWGEPMQTQVEIESQI